MGRGFRLQVQFIEYEAKIEVSLGEIRIGFDSGHEMIPRDRPMAHLIMGNALGVVEGGRRIAVRRRRQRLVHGTSVLQNDNASGDGESNEIHDFLGYTFMFAVAVAANP